MLCLSVLIIGRFCRAKSDKDFINKMKIVEEECDETIYWLEIIEESGLAKIEVVTPLKREAKENSSDDYSFYKYNE